MYFYIVCALAKTLPSGNDISILLRLTIWSYGLTVPLSLSRIRPLSGE